MPTVSEIYPSYFGRFQTRPSIPTITSCPCSTKRGLSATDLRGNLSAIVELFTDYEPRDSGSTQPSPTDEEQAWKRQRNRASKEPTDIIRWLRKTLSAPGGIGFLVSKCRGLLSTSASLALAHSHQTLTSLRQRPKRTPKLLPLFPDYC